ncbi:MAG: T9SS type A sorting domain-containing protein [Bacteroidota bacterium]
MKTHSASSGNYYSLFMLLIILLLARGVYAQNQSSSSAIKPDQNSFTPTIPVHPTIVGTGTFLGETRPLRDLPALTADEFNALKLKNSKRTINEEKSERTYPFAETALPKGEDGAWQKNMGTQKLFRSPLKNFEGQESGSRPSDDNGTVGKNHYMQTMNDTYAIYDKTGTLVAGPTDMNLLFGNKPGANRNDGDPVILYDEQADRWLATEFSVPKDGTPNYILMAVSSTNDPTGTWYPYSFKADIMPDYPKFGVWQDGYYMGDNNNSGGRDTYVYERSKMLVGDSIPKFFGIKNPYRPGGSGGFRVVPPVDNDGPFAPAGSPGIYIAINDDASSGTKDQIWIYELAVNWTDTAASTFNRVQQLDVTPFNSNFGSNWEDIRQKGTTQKVDAVPTIIMNVPQYRNFGSYQTIVCCHTVNIDQKGQAGIRWYELRKTGSDWSIRQEGTYAPDTNSRWMGSIMLNGSNTIGLGYSISSDGEYPGIRYCGQSATAYLAGNSILDIAEDTIWVGTTSQSGGSSPERWGDYTSLSVDPSDDQTFWYTNQYATGAGTPKTRIASFKIIDPLGVSNPAGSSGNQVSIYPNPTMGIFRIVPSNESCLTLNVLVEDQSGRAILEKKFSGKKEYSIDLSQASQGIYNIVIKTADWMETKKLVVKR